METLNYRIINNDKRKKPLNKIEKNLKDTCSELDWYYEEKTKNDTSIAILVTKRIDYQEETKAILTIFLINDCVNINIAQISFHNHLLEPFLLAFLSKLDDTIFKIINKKDENSEKKLLNNSDELLNRIFEKFHGSCQQLSKRHNNRNTLIIEDEYDVQDYLHSLLTIFFEDIRDEDPVPKTAGASSRGDFFLAKEGIMIETKISSDKNKDKEIGEQIILDIKKYPGNKNVKKIYFFVYNPLYKLKNPVGLEEDLSKDKNIEVIVKVFPK